MVKKSSVQKGSIRREKDYEEVIAMIENVPLAMFLVDESRIVRQANPAAARFAGSTLDKIKGKRGGESFNCANSDVDPRGCGFSRDCRSCLIKRSVAKTFLHKKGLRNIEASLSVKAGRKVKKLDLLVHTSLVRVGSELLSLVCIEDVSERKKNEKEMQRLASFPKLDPNPILEVDFSGKVVFYNGAAREIIRKMGKGYGIKSFIPADFEDIVRRLKDGKVKALKREKRIGRSIFGQSIYLAPKFDVIRIYADDITKKKEAQKKTLYLSNHDKLTGLKNRHFFEKQLAKFAKKESYNGGVVMADINNLKKVNDTYGHSMGDKVIKEIARLIDGNFRKGDVVARIGGDEFSVLLPEIDKKELLQSAKRLQEKVDEFQMKKGNKIIIGVAIGAVHVKKGKEIPLALKSADRLMYENKFSLKKKLSTSTKA